MSQRVGVIGSGQTRYVSKRRDAETPELVYQATSAALHDAGLERKDVDSVVFGSAPEAFEGVNTPDKWCAGAAGALGNGYMRIHTGGATGGSTALAAYSHVASGLADVVIAVAVQRMGESPSAQRILNTIWDPLYERDLPLNIIVMAALRADGYMKRYGFTERQMAKVAVKNRRNGLLNEYAHLRKEITIDDVFASRSLCAPIKLFDACPRSDGACAVIFASERFVRSRGLAAAWVNGVGSCSDTYYVGDRLGDDMRCFGRAVASAYGMAGISRPAQQIQVVELYAAFSYMELVDYHILGLCAEGQGGAYIDRGGPELGGAVPVNPSGGPMCSHPIGATGLVRVAEAASQILDRAGAHQVTGVRNAVATSQGGATQFFTVMVLGSKPN
jgi:acetyl-CoA C-acetyltransferase